MKSSFPHARSIIAVWLKSERAGKETVSVRYYISSHAPNNTRPLNGTNSSVDTGAGENRNHWSRDAIWREDATSNRNPNLVGNIALLRNALLAIAAEELEA